eukprot:gnl/TRDRNA2_/TRDRNA2_194463_c0_seq1.p1 gnl/TRDRNA2_/TRDRNA2_194463_c0~~gnl/TRDRNA2_/TRDRNA2_194463_c0_seq1.p1  ORF type:complete len:323 (-),score=40.31 gnl/TRDRNA2_/TRDRNA2_194463_c0_seq1:80-985(-)
MPSTETSIRRRVLVFGWGEACEEVLRVIAKSIERSDSESAAVVLCVSHVSQACACDLCAVCAELGFDSALHDDDAGVLAASQAFAPDLIISASYRRRLPNSVLALCPGACINFHPSLLPRHRGCWSGFWAIFEGDAETGVTCHHMLEKFDAGCIIHQERYRITADDTSASLYRNMLPVTRSCARHVLSRYFNGDEHGSGRGCIPEGTAQEGEPSYHYRKLPYGGVIQLEWSDAQVARFIRAMEFPPYEGAVVLVGYRRVPVNSLEDYIRIRQELVALAATATATAAATEAPARIHAAAVEA